MAPVRSETISPRHAAALLQFTRRAATSIAAFAQCKLSMADLLTLAQAARELLADIDDDQAVTRG